MVSNDGRRNQHVLENALAANYDRLSRSQRLVIDRLLSDTRYAAVISAPELALEVGVSESTVTRAAQALGFNGYPDMQMQIRKEFLSLLPERVEAEVRQLGDTPAAAAVQVILEDAQSVRLTAEDLQLDRLGDIVESLVNARRIFVFGSRGSYGLAQMLAFGLRLLVDDARLLSEEAGGLADQLAMLTPDDALVAISFRRVDRVTVSAVKHASNAGTTTIAISDALHSPIARMAKHALIARLGPLRLMPSYAAGASLVNALITAVSLRTLENVADRLKTAERLWSEFEIHVEDD
jgi:DNA-binding MurR/RpiR family transcriptional regulator